MNLTSGKIWGSITPSKTILTEFETPSGVASVRGTEVGFDADPTTGAVSVDVGPDSELVWLMLGETAEITIDTGDTFTVSIDASGQISIEVQAGEITIETATGNRCNNGCG